MHYVLRVIVGKEWPVTGACVRNFVRAVCDVSRTETVGPLRNCTKLFRSIRRQGLILFHTVLFPLPAVAGGGAHIVDDAAVEQAGKCHVESWATSATGGSGLVNASPACTISSFPMLELGGFVAHGWTLDDNDTLVGLSPKLMLRSEERGLGIGISTNLAYGMGSRRIETASVIIPLTVPISETVRLNLNAGWQWTRIAAEHDLFAGGQIEISLAESLGFMTEAFVRDRGRFGAQGGLRWVAPGGDFDIDLLVGRYLDGETPRAITVGLTLH